MFQELKFQLSTAILTILTLAASVAAVFNFDQIHRTDRLRLADDGAIWIDHKDHVEALNMPRDSSAAKAGLRKGDRLLKINGIPIEKAVHVAQVLAQFLVDYGEERGTEMP